LLHRVRHPSRTACEARSLLPQFVRTKDLQPYTKNLHVSGTGKKYLKGFVTCRDHI
jgi:hypothetical protein